MKTSPIVFLFASALLLPAADSTSEPPIRLQVDLAAPGKAISPDLVGVFFEDLNYAADGGLYAELIQNRSFEYRATLVPTRSDPDARFVAVDSLTGEPYSAESPGARPDLKDGSVFEWREADGP